MDQGIDQALAAMPYGLYFLSCGNLASPQGMLISWVSQVSGNPPLLMVAVRQNRNPLPALRKQKAFALNLLPASSEGLWQELARPSEERFQGVPLGQGPLGLPVLVQGLGALCCTVRETYVPGDHALLLGEVTGALWRGGDQALTVGNICHYYLGRS